MREIRRNAAVTRYEIRLPHRERGKLVMELLRTLAFDVTLEMQEPDEDGKVKLDPKAINTLALAMQRLEAAGKWNIQREQAMRESLVTEVETKLKGAPRKLDAESLALVRQAIRGDA